MHSFSLAGGGELRGLGRGNLFPGHGFSVVDQPDFDDGGNGAPSSSGRAARRCSQFRRRADGPASSTANAAAAAFAAPQGQPRPAGECAAKRNRRISPPCAVDSRLRNSRASHNSQAIPGIGRQASGRRSRAIRAAASQPGRRSHKAVGSTPPNARNAGSDFAPRQAIPRHARNSSSDRRNLSSIDEKERQFDQKFSRHLVTS